MKFTLTYDGELPSTGNGSRKTQKKWEIRKHFAPQLEDLWKNHPALHQLRFGAPIWKAAPTYRMTEIHHAYDTLVPSSGQLVLADGQIDLCELINRHGVNFKPIVRNSFALTCSLNILFLRKEIPGRVYQGGDLDNRIKTLLDALSVPAHKEQIIHDPTIVDPVLCLVEDDSLVTGLSVRTDRLLSVNNNDSEVKLTIEVDVRVSDSRLYNSMFLGD